MTDRQWTRGWEFAKFFVHNTVPGDAILKHEWPVWEGGGASFWVTRTNVNRGPTNDWYNAHTHGDVSHPAHKDTWINIPNPWSFKLCFGGTATLWVDYMVSLPVPFDGNCTEAIELPGPTGPPDYRPGWDRTSFYVNVFDDNHEDSGETIVITLQDPQGVKLAFSLLGGDTLTYSIHNDDPPLVPEAPISHDTGPVTEGDPARFALIISPRPTSPTDVTVKLTGAHGYFASDQSRTLTVQVPTSGIATFEVPTVGDNVRESDAKIIATVIAGDGYQPDSDPEDATASVKVLDDDPNGIAPMLSIAADAASVVEGDAARYTISTDPKPNTPLKVRVTVSQDGSWGVKTGTRTVTIGSTGTAVFKVDTSDDTRYEPDGSVTVTIDDHYDYDLDATATSAMVIVTRDDIRLPQVSISDASSPETDSFLWFDYTLDKPAANAVYVSMALESGSAKYGDDFIRLSSSVKIPAGQTSVQYRVYVFGDNTPEGPETFTARISRVNGGPAEAHAIQRAATGTITDVAAPQNTQPEVSIASDGDITEGGAASFTLTASPAPDSALSVSVSVTQSGDFGVTTGARTVSIPTSGTYTLTVATTNDSADEADGSVTATVNTGTGYTVSSSGGAATVAVADNDDPPAEKIEQTCKLPSDAMSVAEITGWRDALDSSRAGAGIKRFNRVLSTLGVDTGETPMTVEQAQAVSNWLKNIRWDRTARTLEALDQCDDPPPLPPPPPAKPEISIASDGDITEGGNASFPISASPAPAASLSVSVSVSQSGDYGVSTGARTVTIPTSGTYTLSVATSDDSADEADGSVTATVSTGTGYTVSSSASAATVAVSDNDDPPVVTPVITIAAGSAVTEGSDATFTVTATSNPTSALTVNLTVSENGNFGVTTGADTVTIPASGSATFMVITTDDSTDEPDGSVTATLSTGTGYTVSGTNNAATVAVSDDDDPPPVTPTISISAGSSITEGCDASFTVTASPTPTSALIVYVTISQSGNFGATIGSRTIIIPTSGSLTFTVSTANDNTDEPNGSVTATLTTGTGYTVSSNSTATVAVSDDDSALAGPPTVTVSDATASEGDGHLTFTVTLSHVNPKIIKFRYGGFGRSATIGQDFNMKYKAFTLNAGDTTLDIDVPIFDDSEVESDETIAIYVYATSGITIPDYFVYADGTIAGG